MRCEGNAYDKMVPRYCMMDMVVCCVCRDWMDTFLCQYKMCCFVWLMQILQVPTQVSQSSYDDSSWRQTAFSQSAALMFLFSAPLCVARDDWALSVLEIIPLLGPSLLSLKRICPLMARAAMPVSAVHVSHIKTGAVRMVFLCLQSCAYSTGGLPV